MPRLSIPRVLLRLVTGWAGLLVFGTPLAMAGEVRIELPTSPVRSNDQFQWVIPIRVVNSLDSGVYVDSVICEIEDRDPGVTRAGRRMRGISYRLKNVRGLARADSVLVQYTAPAVVENGRLQFKLYSHTTEGGVHVSEGSCETVPSFVARRFRSEFIEARGLRVEVTLVPQPWPRGSSPGLLLVHPERSHARRLLPLAWELANQGMTVMLVSMPGYGQSDGEADFAGPATVRALELALDRLRRTPPVDSTRIAVWGISRGASAAALLAAQRRDLSGLILQSGVFEPKTAYRNTVDDSLRWALDHEAKGQGGWSKRSAIRLAKRITAPALFMHGELDPVAPSSETVELAARLRVAGVDVKLELFPTGGHELPLAVTQPRVKEFLEQRIGAVKH
jgi:pimeloyl-ACP methyl ester carboxylesterase